MLGAAALYSLVKLTPEIIKYINTSKYTTNEIGQKVVELVVRNAKGQFVSFTKCVLPNVSDTAKNQVAQMAGGILKNGLSVVSTASSLANNIQTEMVRRAVKEVGKDVKQVLKGVDMLKNMSWITMGLSAANIGVSAAGFTIMNQKLNEMDRKLNDIQTKVTAMGKQVDDVHRMNIQAMFFSPVNNISMKSKQITSKLLNNEKVSREEINDLLQAICMTARNALTLTNIIPVEDLLEILYTILPVAVNMIDLYYAEYYEFTGEKGHPLHSTLKQLLEDCCGDAIRRQIEDRYYLEKGCHGKMVETIIGYHELICADLQNKMEDTFQLRKECDSKERFEELKEVSSKLAAAMAAEYIPVVEQDQGSEEAVKVLNNAAEETFGMQIAAVA